MLNKLEIYKYSKDFRKTKLQWKEFVTDNVRRNTDIKRGKKKSEKYPEKTIFMDHLKKKKTNAQKKLSAFQLVLIAEWTFIYKWTNLYFKFMFVCFFCVCAAKLYPVSRYFSPSDVQIDQRVFF